MNSYDLNLILGGFQRRLSVGVCGGEPEGALRLGLPNRHPNLAWMWRTQPYLPRPLPCRPDGRLGYRHGGGPGAPSWKKLARPRLVPALYHSRRSSRDFRELPWGRLCAEHDRGDGRDLPSHFGYHYLECDVLCDLRGMLRAWHHPSEGHQLESGIDAMQVDQEK